MSTATLILTDVTDEGGAISARIDFGPGGFDPNSHAHQHAYLLVKHMDENLCKRLDEPKAETGIVLPDGTVV